MDVEVEPTVEIEALDLGAFADPNIQGINLNAASYGDSARLAAIKCELQREEERGFCKILLMSDGLVVVHWFDQFVLTLNETSISNMAAIPREVS